MFVRRFAPVVVVLVATMMGIPAAQATGANVRLTNDDPSLSGYTSDYTLVTGTPYTDAVLSACSQSRGRQNEPAVAVDPRNPDVIVGSSNDYCPVLNADGSFLGLGDIWLGYYRSEDGGQSFTSSLVPGYQGDQSPYAARASRILATRSSHGIGMGACLPVQRAPATSQAPGRRSVMCGLRRIGTQMVRAERRRTTGR